MTRSIFLRTKGAFGLGATLNCSSFRCITQRGRPLIGGGVSIAFRLEARKFLYNRLPAEAIEARQRITWAYASQWLYMVPARMASSRARLTRIGEPYRQCPRDRDHTVRPHPGKLNYERWFCSFMRIRVQRFQGCCDEGASDEVIAL